MKIVFEEIIEFIVNLLLYGSLAAFVATLLFNLTII